MQSYLITIKAIKLSLYMSSPEEIAFIQIYAMRNFQTVPLKHGFNFFLPA